MASPPVTTQASNVPSGPPDYWLTSAKTESAAASPPRRRSENRPDRGGRNGPARRGIVIGATVGVVGLAAVIGWQTSWPPQLFTAHESSLTAPNPATASSSLPAAQQSSSAAQSPAATGALPSSDSGLSPEGAPSASVPSDSVPSEGAPSAGVPSGGAPAPDSAPATESGPAGTVQAYFSDINAHNYSAAWKIVKKIAGPYSSFVAGFDTTEEDTVTIVSVSGDQVEAQLVADQTDGTIKDYSGVYTVVNGAIVQAQVQQTN